MYLLTTILCISYMNIYTFADHGINFLYNYLIIDKYIKCFFHSNMN